MKIKPIFYVQLGLLAAIGATAGISFSMASNQTDQTVEIQEVTAKIKRDKTCRNEYLVGEPVDLNGLTFYYEDRVFDLNNVEIDNDFTTGGLKSVKLSYLDGFTKYVAKYYVNVFTVRHIDIRSIGSITKTEDETYLLNDAVVWAHVSAPTTNFELVEQHKDSADVIVLNENQYTYSVTPGSETESDVFNVQIKCGNADRTTQFLDANIIPEVGEDKTVTLNNAGDGGETLKLYVTRTVNSTSTASDPGGAGLPKKEVYGRYVLSDSVGNNKKFSFWHTQIGTQSFYNSVWTDSRVNEQSKYQGNSEAYSVTLDGHTFYAIGYQWKHAVLDEETITPNVASERVCDFTNLSGGQETLKLYVTDNSRGFVTPDWGSHVDVSGVYVFTKNGKSTIYGFSYALDGSISTFRSNSTYKQQLSEEYTNGNFFDVRVGGVTFRTASEAGWHLSMLGHVI